MLLRFGIVTADDEVVLDTIGFRNIVLIARIKGLKGNGIIFLSSL